MSSTRTETSCGLRGPVDPYGLRSVELQDGDWVSLCLSSAQAPGCSGVKRAVSLKPLFIKMEISFC